MDRWQIIVIALVVGVIWWFAKRHFGQKKEQKDQGSTIYMNVNTWFHKAQEMISVMDADIKKERKAAWQAMPQEEKMRLTEEFMAETFGPDESKKYNADEKLELGEANYMLRGR